MNALDSAYEWGVDPLNVGNLNQQQRQGLAALAPQTGLGLAVAPHPRVLAPFSALPTPQFAPNAADSFQFGQDQANSALLQGQDPNSPVNYPVPSGMGPGDLDHPSSQPYFDPNYPVESMVALEHWLGPKAAAAVPGVLAARGLTSTGVGAYAQQDVQNYLHQLAPVSGQEAFAIDLDRLYGPSVVNSLIQGGTAHDYNATPNMLPAAVRYPTVHTPGVIPGAAPFGDGSTSSAAVFTPGSGTPNSPQFGLYDLASGGDYVTPGYFYNPAAPPDTSQMPWLNPSLLPGEQPRLRLT